MLRKKYLVTGLYTLLLVTAMLLSGCHGPEHSDGDPIVIGGLLVLSGPAGSLGESGKRGMELARDEINAEGGIDGRMIELRFADTKLDPTEAARAFQNLISDGDIDAVVGALASGVTAAVIPAADEAEVVLISPASTRADLTVPRQSPFFFRTIPSDVIQGTKAANLVFQDLEQDQVVVMFQNNAYATGLKNVFVQEYTRIGGTVSGEPISFHETDVATYPSAAQDAADRDPAFIWMSTQYPEAGHMIKELRAAGYDGPILASEAIEDAKMFEISQDATDALEGVLFTKPAVDTSSAAYTGFEEDFRAKFNEAPGPYSTYGYDALYVIAQAYREGATDGDALRQEIQDGTVADRVSTASISFNQNGDVTVGDYVLWEVDATGKAFRPYEDGA